MAGYLRSPLTYTWIFLVLATLLSWGLGARIEATAQHAHSTGPTLVLLVAVIKCRVVMRSYMDVRAAPSWLQRTCDVWLVFTFAMTSSSYWFVA